MARVYRALILLVTAAALAVTATALSGFHVRQVRVSGGFLPPFFPNGEVGGWPFPFVTLDRGFGFNPYFFAIDCVLWFLPLLVLAPLLLWAYSKLRRHSGR